MKMFTVKDIKGDIYMQPFFVRTTALAIREIEQATNNPESIFNKYPEDYSLYEIGEFDQETAEVNLHDDLVKLCNCSELKKPDSQMGLPGVDHIDMKGGVNE